MPDDAAYLLADAEDRRAALTAAAQMAVTRGDIDLLAGDKHWLRLASRAYDFLRSRASLRAVSVQLVPGTPYKEGTSPVTATIDLSDIDAIPFSLTGLDEKGAATPLPAGFTATWTLADPDASGAVLTPSADGTTAVLAAGNPDANVMVSVSFATTDGSGNPVTLTGAEAVIVQASAAATIGLVPGTPTPETAPAS